MEQENIHKFVDSEGRQMRILFQGDSITDAGRDKSDPHHLGGGYPKFAAELIRGRFPGKDFEFLNLGISGDRSRDLLARWQADCIDWQPDVVSILIGINDTWRAFDSNSPTSAQAYEDNVRRLLEDIKAHTKAKILMMEPFLLQNSPDKDAWREDLNPKIMAARRLAREYADAYLPLDGLFATASVRQEPAYWAGDGVHPSEAGARFIAEYYAGAIAPLLD